MTNQPSIDPTDQATGDPAAAGLDEAARARRADRLVEIVALLLLGVGTVLAAWSGYQSALWNGIQADDYARGSGQRIEAAKAATLAGQERLYDSQVFGEWLDADDAGDTRLATLYERRFSEEFRVAFEAWLATDPRNDPNAPAGPHFMREYIQAGVLEADRLETQARALIAAGEEANDVSDHYVLFTVVFATVLFLAAVAERFRWRKAQVAVLGIGTAVLIFGVIGLLQLPIA